MIRVVVFVVLAVVIAGCDYSACPEPDFTASGLGVCLKDGVELTTHEVRETVAELQRQLLHVDPQFDDIVDDFNDYGVDVVFVPIDYDMTAECNGAANIEFCAKYAGGVTQDFGHSVYVRRITCASDMSLAHELLHVLQYIRSWEGTSGDMHYKTGWFNETGGASSVEEMTKSSLRETLGCGEPDGLP